MAYIGCYEGLCRLFKIWTKNFDFRMKQRIKRFFIMLIVRFFTKGIKYRLYDVWWNYSLHSSEVKYPIVRWQKAGYVAPEKGLIMAMDRLENGKYVYYEVIKIRRKPGGDWLYDSDCYEVDMKFSFLDEQLGIGGTDKIIEKLNSDRPKLIKL